MVEKTFQELLADVEIDKMFEIQDDVSIDVDDSHYEEDAGEDED